MSSGVGDYPERKIPRWVLDASRRFSTVFSVGTPALLDGCWRCRLGVPGLFKKAVPRQKDSSVCRWAVLLGKAEGEISAAGMAGSTVCDPAGQKDADRRKPGWAVFSRHDGSASAAGGALVWASGAVVLILLGMAVQPFRFFCQFLCPMGAVFAWAPVLLIQKSCTGRAAPSAGSGGCNARRHLCWHG